MDVIQEVMTQHFWESKSLGSLEHIRLELRDLLQYLDGGTAGQTFTVILLMYLRQTNPT